MIHDNRNVFRGADPQALGTQHGARRWLYWGIAIAGVGNALLSLILLVRSGELAPPVAVEDRSAPNEVIALREMARLEAEEQRLELLLRRERSAGNP